MDYSLRFLVTSALEEHGIIDKHEDLRDWWDRDPSGKELYKKLDKCREDFTRNPDWFEKTQMHTLPTILNKIIDNHLREIRNDKIKKILNGSSN